jgi:hypothetical protein
MSASGRQMTLTRELVAMLAFNPPLPVWKAVPSRPSTMAYVSDLPQLAGATAAFRGIDR